jgi:hypothetical protein
MNARRGAGKVDGAIPARNGEARDPGRIGKAMRVIADQHVPALPIAIAIGAGAATGKLAASKGTIEFDWASETARHVGTVVHAFLHRIAEDGLDRWSAGRIMALSAGFKRELGRLGVGDAELPAAIERVAEALTRTLADARGRWILQSHAHARSEWRVTGFAGDTRTNVAIDRSFVDDTGVRWIIDFKTGGHHGADAAVFLDNEQARYREQLETYASLLLRMQPAHDAPSFKLGLYFPLLSGWREWDWLPSQSVR